MCNGLLTTKTHSMLALGLMSDELQEFSELSNDLRHRNVGLSFAKEKLNITVALFENMKSVVGTYYFMAQQALNNLTFFNAPFTKKKVGMP